MAALGMAGNGRRIRGGSDQELEHAFQAALGIMASEGTPMHPDDVDLVHRCATGEIGVDEMIALTRAAAERRSIPT